MTPNYPTSYICFTTYKPEKPPSTINHYQEEEFAPGSRRIQEVVDRPSACPVSQSRKRKLNNSLIITALPAPRHNPALLLLIAFPWQTVYKEAMTNEGKSREADGSWVISCREIEILILSLDSERWLRILTSKYWTQRGDWEMIGENWCEMAVAS